MKRFQLSACSSALALCSVAVNASFAQTPAPSAGPSAGWAVISAVEYGALRGKAYPATPEPPGPPVEATLTRVEYELRIANGIATGNATLTVDVLSDAWVRVPIPAGLMVREARINGDLVSLTPGTQGGGTNQSSAMLSGRGRATLLLDVATAVSQAGGEEKLWLPASDSGVTAATIALDRQGDLDVKATGGLITDKTPTASGSRWTVFGRGSEPLVVTWRRKLEENPVELAPRVRGSLTELAGLGEDSTSIYAEVDLTVEQGTPRQTRVRIPEGVTINQVLGANVADWDVKTGELIVTFLDPVAKAARFVITGETHLPREGDLEIPLLRLLDTERESGGVAVEVVGAGEIVGRKPRGLEPADPAELGAAVAGRQSPSLTAWKVRAGSGGEARSLGLRMVRYTQQAVLTANIEEARYRVLLSADGKTLVEARYAVRNNQRSFVKIKLPAGAAVWSASVAGNPVRPGVAEDGSLLLPLSKARAGEEAPASTLEIFYLGKDTAWMDKTRSDKGRAVLSLPALDLPVSRTGVVLYYPPLFRVTPESGALRMDTYRDPVSETLNSRGAAAAPARTGPMGTSQNDPLQQFNSNAAQAATQALVDRFLARSEQRARAAATPIEVWFPAVGRSIFLVSELTGENQAASVGLIYQREKRGDVR